HPIDAIRVLDQPQVRAAIELIGQIGEPIRLRGQRVGRPASELAAQVVDQAGQRAALGCMVHADRLRPRHRELARQCALADPGQPEDHRARHQPEPALESSELGVTSDDERRRPNAHAPARIDGNIRRRVVDHGYATVLPSLSIVIPAYNEAASIEATVADALAVGAAHASALEVIVCNDASRDATGARDPRVVALHRAHNRGIEASIRTLYAHARHAWVFLNSADRQWPMTALVPMAAAAEAGADFVIGVRSNKREVYTPYRRLISWSYERIVRALGAPGGDPGSIKLARRELLHRAVVARGVFAEGERVIRAARGGARVVEVPVEFHRRAEGKATGARRDVVVRAVLDVGRVTASLALGAPAPRLPVPDVER